MLAKRRLLGFGCSIKLRLKHGAPSDTTAPEQGAGREPRAHLCRGLRPDQRDHNPAGNLGAGVLPARFGEH